MSEINRINRCFADLKATNRKAFVAYIVNGDPYPSATLSAMYSLVENGADVIELGVPFSDPMAEGPVIQKGHERALQHGVSLLSTFEVVKQFRQTNTKTPIVLMGYANPIERMGYSAFASAAVAAGVDGVLTVDLPPEESADLNEVLQSVGMEMIYLIAPTTSPARIRHIASLASGFLYYVSLKGVTGAGHLDIDAVKNKIDTIKKITDLPLCVGFGIKDGESARAVSEHAQGAIVGSVFVDKLAQLRQPDNRSGETDKLQDELQAVGQLAADIRQGLDR